MPPAHVRPSPNTSRDIVATMNVAIATTPADVRAAASEDMPMPGDHRKPADGSDPFVHPIRKATTCDGDSPVL